MLFRFHRGGLSESMQTVFEANTQQELVTKIEESYKSKLIGELEFSKPIWDSRVGWNTHTVSGVIEGYGKHVIGQSNGSL
jgi:hypothetical protein